MANTFTERIKLILTGAKKATRDAKKFERGLAGIQKQALAAGAAFFGTQGIIQGMKESVQLSAKFEEVQRGFMKLGAGVDISHTSILRLRSAVNDTVNDVDLMTMANQALMLGVASSTDEMVIMFDAAQRLGTALGKDVKDSIDSLVTGMGRQSIQMLDNLGIIVSAELANDRYAKKMGIVGRALDANERKLAFNAEATRQLTGAVDKLGDETVSSAMKLQQASSAWENFLKEVGDGFTPLTNTIVDFTGWAKESGIITDDLATALGSQGLAGSYDEAKLAVAEYMQGIKEQQGLTGGLASTQDLMKMSTQEFLVNFRKFRNELGDQGWSFPGFDRSIFLDALPALDIYATEYLKFIGKKVEEDKKSAVVMGDQNVQLEKQMNLMIPFIDLNAQLGSQIELDIKRQNDLYNIEQKRLQTRKDQINMAMALGAAEANLADAVSKASATYIADYIRKIVATYIFETFKEGGFLGGLAGVATGAAFGNLVGQTINSVAAAEGFDGVVTEPTLFLAGEQGAEYVDIEPTTNEGANRGGATIIFQGNVMSQDFIEDEAIPMIREALRKGGDIGIG